MPYNSTPKGLPIKRIRRRAIFIYTVTSLILVAVTCFLLFITLGRIADKKESRLLESATRNTALAAESFVKECESECNEVFVNETIAKYSPYILTDTGLTYEQSRSEIKSQLSKISAGKCYNDFFIIYSNSETVGNVSQGATDIAVNSGYQAYSGVLGDKSDTWCFGEISGYSKIFYFRRMNADSVFVMSCYIDSLNDVFPAYHKGSVVGYILTDDNGCVIYSDIEKVKAGNSVPSVYSSLFTEDNESVIDDFYIASRIKLKNGWSVYAITKNSDFIPNYTIIITIIIIAMSSVALISILIGIVTFAVDAGDTEALTGGEYLDPITGTLNEYGLDEMISEMLETSIVGSTYAFILIGIKDSEQIKSTVSLRYWNDIRFSLAEKAEKFFENRKHHIGRAYDDYITVFADYSEFDLFKAHDELNKNCEELYAAFKDFAIGSGDSLKLNVTIGVSVYPDHGDDFDTLLGKARQAYKLANRKDDNRIGFYKQRTADENGKEES